MQFEDALLGRAVARESIRRDPLGRTTDASKQAAEEALRCIRIPLLLHEDIQHQATFIDCALQIDLLAPDPHEDLIQVPGPAGMPLPAAQLVREALAELLYAGTDTLVGNHDSPLEQQLLDISKAEREAMIQSDGIADDRGGETMPVEMVRAVGHKEATRRVVELSAPGFTPQRLSCQSLKEAPLSLKAALGGLSTSDPPRFNRRV